MNNRPPTPEEKHIYRCYYKHFHPDKFFNHPKHALVVEVAKVVNICYEARCEDSAEVIIELGRALKGALKSA